MPSLCCEKDDWIRDVFSRASTLFSKGLERGSPASTHRPKNPGTVWSRSMFFHVWALRAGVRQGKPWVQSLPVVRWLVVLSHEKLRVSTKAALRAEGLAKIFHSGSEQVVVFEDLSFEVSSGEFVALVGESGSGKTTLLHLLAALDTPTRGEVYFEGERLSEFSKDERALYRNEKIGFVWQMHYLLPEFSALENVVIPQLIGGRQFPRRSAQRRG